MSETVTVPEAPTAGKADVILDVDHLQVHFKLRGAGLSRILGREGGIVKAVDDVTIALKRGEVFGLVGESGSGKTTLGRAVLGLVPITGGLIRHQSLDGGAPVDIASLKGKKLRKHRQKLQMVFQDPHAALNPAMTIETQVGHPLVIHGRAKGAELKAKVKSALEHVGLAPAEQFMSKYPSDLSGGQKQRAVIARAIILEPEVLVADEPVSMLDMSVRAKILQLMLDLKQYLQLTYIYITHDLATAKFFCDRVAIMYLGKIVEVGPTAEIFAEPRHPYTQALLKAIPDVDPSKMVPRDLPRGEIPDAARPPRGCSFHPRCPLARAECGWEPRDLKAMVDEHWTRVSVEQFEKEQALVGNLKELNTDKLKVKLEPAHGGSVDELWTMFENIRTENPEEPLWRGVTRMEKVKDGVVIEFAKPAEIALHPVGNADVSCVLY
ncbi:MAG: ABC transporter ATP-binding protein [Propionibacteriaceae bacterium]|jgi:peptide/nickel transport system ATP-binding protein|nr:ABC transporter ATP-binding protein [Propionibacteriaceae bacterium]